MKLPLYVVLGFFSVTAWAETPAPVPTTTPAATAAPETTPQTPPAAAPSYWEAVRKVTESYVGEAQKTATETAATAATWSQEDLANAGTWLYKVEVVSLGNPAELEAKLATIGKEKWELVTLREDKGNALLIFKKPAVSVVGSLFQAVPYLSGTTRSAPNSAPKPK